VTHFKFSDPLYTPSMARCVNGMENRNQNQNQNVNV